MTFCADNDCVNRLRIVICIRSKREGMDVNDTITGAMIEGEPASCLTGILVNFFEAHQEMGNSFSFIGK